MRDNTSLKFWNALYIIMRAPTLACFECVWSQRVVRCIASTAGTGTGHQEAATKVYELRGTQDRTAPHSIWIFSLCPCQTEPVIGQPMRGHSPQKMRHNLLCTKYLCTRHTSQNSPFRSTAYLAGANVLLQARTATRRMDASEGHTSTNGDNSPFADEMAGGSADPGLKFLRTINLSPQEEDELGTLARGWIPGVLCVRDR